MDFTSNIALLKQAYSQWDQVTDVGIEEDKLELYVELTVNDTVSIDKTPLAEVRAQYIKKALLSLMNQHKSTLLNEAKTEIENELAAIKAIADTTP